MKKKIKKDRFDRLLEVIDKCKKNDRPALIKELIQLAIREAEIDGDKNKSTETIVRKVVDPNLLIEKGEE